MLHFKEGNNKEKPTGTPDYINKCNFYWQGSDPNIYLFPNSYKIDACRGIGGLKGWKINSSNYPQRTYSTDKAMKTSLTWIRNTLHIIYRNKT